MAKPIREFSADVGQKSMGVAGPDFIERDLDKLFAMVDPNKNLPTGEQGGIGSENMKPGAVTAEQTGALVSVDGVSNPGGDIDFVAGTGMEITPDATGKKITFAAKNDSIIPGPHAETHRSGGSDPITPEDIGATATPTANKIAMYDSEKRLSSGAAPSNDNHVVRKTDFDTHVNSNSAHSATATPSANKIAMYDSGKRLSSGAAPTSDNHVVRKTDLDAKLEAVRVEFTGDPPYEIYCLGNIVFVRIQVAQGQGDTLVTTIPSGYRPKFRQYGVAMCQNPAGGDYRFYRIELNGEVRCPERQSYDTFICNICYLRA